MQERSQALLASAVLLAGSAAAALAAEPPLKTLPWQQDIWCNDRVVTDIVLGKAGVPDHLLLLPYLGQRVAVKGRVICPNSGIKFTPTPDFVFPIY
ncbi:hypothetical protein P3T40_004649 [Paraburkholderia sp. EB58]|jgi:hypothetical protein|uniref:hypothetical protein n=1 Tax=Paraburkholderia sp. EB58 TaxID=3035125 RepID=UPI003D1DE045